MLIFIKASAIKSILFLFNLIIFVTISTSSAAPLHSSGSQNNLKKHYYSSGKKKNIVVSEDYIGVEFSRKLSRSQVMSIISSVSGIDLKYKINVVKDKNISFARIKKEKINRKAEIMKQISQLSNVKKIHNVYRSDNNNLVLTEEIIIAFKKSFDESNILGFVESQKLELLRCQEYDTKICVVKDIKQGDVLASSNRLYEMDEVRFAHPNFIHDVNFYFTPNDPLFPLQWHHEQAQSPSAWDITQGSTDVVVAVIDSGVDVFHEDLSANIIPGRDSSTATPPGGVPGNTHGEPHGTAVAGIISAGLDNSLGVSGLAGNVKIMPVVLSSTSEGIAADINWAWQNGADVLSNSWGAADADIIHDSIINAVTNGRNGKGSVVLFASGNSGRCPGVDKNEVAYPAKYPEGIAVGATVQNGFRWDGECYGAELDIVAAGGRNIATTDITGDQGYSIIAGNVGSYFYAFGGTSSACPLAAGLAALIISNDPNLTSSEVRKIIENSADDLIGPNEDSSGWDQYYGYGRINAKNALQGMALDGDNDSIIDAMDNCKMTPNAAQSDADNDGIGDLCEVVDADNDGLSDDSELSFNLDPDNFDTDGDGLNDHFEVCFDGDCFNYEPYHPVNNPLGGDLDATVIDSDMDETSDLSEIVFRHNPLDASDFNLFSVVPGLETYMSTSDFHLWEDFDNDGDMDVFLGNYLLENTANGFVDVTDTSGLLAASNAIAGDFDNDGDRDLYSIKEGILYLNDSSTGGIHFTDITGAVGLTGAGLSAAIFLDFDNDGYLDIYGAVNTFGSSNFSTEAKLYHYNTVTGGFDNVSNQSSVPTDFVNIPVSADFDNDGKIELAVFGGNEARFFDINEQGDFIQISSTFFPDIEEKLSAVVLDYDNDGLQDIVLNSYGFLSGTTGRLFRNIGGMNFSIAEEMATLTGRAGCIGDIDLDGYEDYFSEYIYSNHNEGPIYTRSKDGIDTSKIITSCSFGDYDNDGDLDLVTNGGIYTNRLQNQKYITVQLNGLVSNRDGVGSKIKVTTDNGVFERDVVSSQGNSLSKTFGLGDSLSPIISVNVHWPSGIITEYCNIGINQSIEITEQAIECPQILALFPVTGPVGTAGHISGSNFCQEICNLHISSYPDISVTFNGTPVTNGWVTKTAILFDVPEGATSGPVVVTTPAGSSTAPIDFVVQDAPVINALAPTTGSVGTSGNISGSNFCYENCNLHISSCPDISVTFNGTPVTNGWVTKTAILFDVPEGATSGPVVITTPAGSETAPEIFTVTQ